MTKVNKLIPSFFGRLWMATELIRLSSYGSPPLEDLGVGVAVMLNDSEASYHSLLTHLQ